MERSFYGRDCLAHVIEFSDEAAVSCPYRDDDYHCDSTLQEREIKAVLGESFFFVVVVVVHAVMAQQLVSDELYEKHLARSMRLAEKRIKNTFHCQTADCTGWAVIEDNINVFECPVCSRVNCLTCQVSRIKLDNSKHSLNGDSSCRQYMKGRIARSTRID